MNSSMKHHVKKRMLTGPGMLLISLMLALTGCSSEPAETKSTENRKPTVDTTPVTLQLFLQQSVSDQDVNQIWIEPLKKVYPHITLEIIRPGKEVTMDSLIAAGKVPDIIYAFNGILPGYYLTDLLMDMSPLIKQHQLDLSRFDPAVMQSITAVSKEGSIVALPFTNQFAALYYNKTLFNRFGVPYPKDGMTWDDAIELAKKLSRSEGGVKFAGMDVETVSRVARPLAALKVDGATDKASVNTDAWRKAFGSERCTRFRTMNGPLQRTH
jgi:multiple sugar transport system substrate-binding protein